MVARFVIVPNECDDEDCTERELYNPVFYHYINQAGQVMIAIRCAHCRSIVSAFPIQQLLKELNK